MKDLLKLKGNGAAVCEFYPVTGALCFPNNEVRLKYCSQ